MSGHHAYTMTVDLSVIESLGINLYSNAAAVISELVANAHDADATLVRIDWKRDNTTVTIVDDGCGMSEKELDERFLVVGYKKRHTEGDKSPRWGRPFMGRKGIGKLSIFSIAREVTVYSTKAGESNGFKILVEDLEIKIKEGSPYHPKVVQVPERYQNTGTTIVLEQLKTKRADLTAAALRKRLARRFDVLDQTPRCRGGFKIQINDEDITFEDRQELKKLEFIWEFCEKTLPDNVLPRDIKRFVLPNGVVNADKGWTVTGWIGTARVPSDLTEDEEAGSLKNIIVLARKRPIQEGIVEKLDFSRIFGNYVTGQIEADFLDLDGEDDIATSDRQRMIEDDPRVLALQRFLREAFNTASDTWSDERPKRKARGVFEEFPKLAAWAEGLPAWQRDAAEKMVGTIAAIPMEKRNERADRAVLYRSGILAFARIGLRETSDELNALSDVKAESLLALLGAQDEYEAALWVDILRSRVVAIQQFENLTSENEKEKVLELHLFDHLWLLDASWERATGSERMEQWLHRVDPESFPTDREGNEIRGRIDIRYGTTGGRHVIVELKRYALSPKLNDLVAQGRKYLTALRSVLEQQGKENQNVQVVFVLGRKPKVDDRGRFATDEETVAHALDGIAGSYVLYDELIENACNQYDNYFSASQKAHELDELLESIS